jgi:hypothetical protein
MSRVLSHGAQVSGRRADCWPSDHWLGTNYHRRFDGCIECDAVALAGELLLV